ncbi:hypothetical protein LXA43DRAFT_980959 [Ganoderma leucocontextum]|nr:hypothetical protein LXA43DRAFT_980959 [Ganoderma leucocontextum]
MLCLLLAPTCTSRLPLLALAVIRLMAESLYVSCASVLSLSQAKDDLETLLHPETGFAPRLREICNQQVAGSGSGGDRFVSRIGERYLGTVAGTHVVRVHHTV